MKDLRVIPPNLGNEFEILLFQELFFRFTHKQSFCNTWFTFGMVHPVNRGEFGKQNLKNLRIR